MTPQTPPPLFRVQALKHSGGASHGKVLLARPLSFTVLTALFTGIAIAVVLFFACFSFTRKAQVAGIILPAHGVVRIASAQAGVVSSRPVHEGDHVVAGQVLFGMSNERIGRAGVDVDRQISDLLSQQRRSLEVDQDKQGEQAVQRVEAARRRGDELAADLRHIQAQQALQARRVALAQEAVARTQNLRRDGFVSAAALQDREADLLDQQQRAADLERAANSTQRDIEAARAQLRDAALQGQRDAQNGARSIASLDQQLVENDARREWFVRAEQDGVITGVTVEPGQRVAEDQPMATLLPAGEPLVAELYVPSRSAGFIKPGMVVQLRYQAFAYQKFGQHVGHVQEVSRTAMRPQDLPFSAAAGSEPVYRVRVALDRPSVQAYGQDEPLRPGMTVDASVLLDRRKLYEWVLEPLYSVMGKV
jgi:membrane fusion protein